MSLSCFLFRVLQRGEALAGWVVDSGAPTAAMTVRRLVMNPPDQVRRRYEISRRNNKTDRKKSLPQAACVLLLPAGSAAFHHRRLDKTGAM